MSDAVEQEVVMCGKNQSIPYENLGLNDTRLIATVAVAGFSVFSCGFTGDIGGATVLVRRHIALDSPGDFSSPVTLTNASNNHYALDIKGVQFVSFYVSIAAAGKVINIETLSEAWG